jgi:hypothetical protein
MRAGGGIQVSIVGVGVVGHGMDPYNCYTRLCHSFIRVFRIIQACRKIIPFEIKKKKKKKKPSGSISFDQRDLVSVRVLTL